MKTLSNIFAIVGLLTLGYWIFEMVTPLRYQSREASRFEQERRNHDSAPAIKGPYPPTGSTIAILAIPRLGLSTVVLEGAEKPQLAFGLGHIRGTSLPGSGGNVGVAGHRDTFFRPLRFLRNTDLIKLTTHDHEYMYRVTSIAIVAPDDVTVLSPIGRETLTLVTCYPFNFVGAAPRRFIATADCVDCFVPAQTP
jgi:sortase A